MKILLTWTMEAWGPTGKMAVEQLTECLSIEDLDDSKAVNETLEKRRQEVSELIKNKVTSKARGGCSNTVLFHSPVTILP